MRILGIETSCDETAVCVIEATGALAGAEIKICANITLSQAKLHAPYGGVFPSLAKREHIKNLPVLLSEALQAARLNEKKPAVNAVAVTYGPGLEPCLWAGISFVQELAKKWEVPLVPVNHMEGHIFSALLRRKDELSSINFSAEGGSASGGQLCKPVFPALALLISGGHTELDLMEDYGKYRLIGETRDDAVGEAFDKVARLLGLPYPGGPEISRLADRTRHIKKNPPPNPPPLVKEGGEGGGFSITLPRPMLHSPDYDFSFSGIKTAVLYLLKEGGAPDEATRTALAREFEDAVTEVLVEKTKRALREYGAQTLIVAGGVIANTHIRREFEKVAYNYDRMYKLPGGLHIPELDYTTDNALMIALAAYGKIMRSAPLPAPASIRAKGTAKISEIC